MWIGPVRADFVMLMMALYKSIRALGFISPLVAFFGWGSQRIWVLGFEPNVAMRASFADLEYAARKRATQRDRFLSAIVR